jgi:hypothetical protein
MQGIGIVLIGFGSKRQERRVRRFRNLETGQGQHALVSIREITDVRGQPILPLGNGHA